jgi:hypothetical protein
MSALKRAVQFRPAFDKRHRDPSKNYGIHGVDMRFIVSDERGAVQFVVYTNWHLPHVRDESASKAADIGDPDYVKLMFAPMAADLGYHSPVARYDGQKPIDEACEYLGGRPCFYDGSSLQAERILDTLISEGDEAVWALMEARHANLFGNVPVEVPV